MSLPRVEPHLPLGADPEGQEPQEPAAAKSYECDLCGQTFEGVPGGSGLLLWSRGDEIRFEEPPLCESCAAQITIGAMLRWQVEEEEEG
jgi:hypothetical protein